LIVSLTSEFLSQLLLQIDRGCASQERTLAQEADGAIAPVAEQRADPAGSVIVVNAQVAVWFSADRTDAILLREEFLISGDRQSILSEATRVVRGP